MTIPSFIYWIQEEMAIPSFIYWLQKEMAISPLDYWLPRRNVNSTFVLLTTKKKC
jgi:hypothetical protein